LVAAFHFCRRLFCCSVSRWLLYGSSFLSRLLSWRLVSWHFFWCGLSGRFHCLWRLIKKLFLNLAVFAHAHSFHFWRHLHSLHVIHCWLLLLHHLLLLLLILHLHHLLLLLVHWWQVTNLRLLLFEHLVGLLVFFDLSGQLLDLKILHSELPVDVAIEHCRLIVVIGCTIAEFVDSHIVLFDLLLQCVLLLDLVIDFKEKVDVFLHDLGVLLFVNFLIFDHHSLQVVHVLLEPSSLESVVAMNISVGALILAAFVFDVDLVKSDHASLQLLVICDVMQAIENIIFELLLVSLLVVEHLSEVLHLVGESLLPHAEIVDDKSQVLIDPIEMLQLLPHLVRRLVQSLNFKLTWSDISLQLLDFIIQDELELFKLLRLLFEINDSPIFILDGGITLLKLANLADNLLLKLVGGVVQAGELLLFLGNFPLLLFFFILLFLEVIVNQCQVTFRLHTLIDDLGQLFLILVLQHVDPLPSFVFDALSFLFVALDHLFDLLLKPVGLLNLPVKLYLLILTQFLDDLLVIERKLVESLFKLASIVIFLGLQLVEPLLIGVHLISIVLSPSLLFNLVSLLHLGHLLLVQSIDFFLGFEQFFVSSVVLLLFIFDFLLDFINLLLLSVQVLLQFCFFILFLNFNLASQMLNVSQYLILFLFLDEVVLVLHVHVGAVIFVLFRISVDHVVNSEHSILASREQVRIIVGYPQPFNGQAMSLYLKQFLERKIHHLDGARPVVLSDACEKGAATMQDLDLGEIDACFVREDGLVVFNDLDRLVDTGGKDD